MTTLEEELIDIGKKVDEVLLSKLTKNPILTDDLNSAMLYSVIGVGKRLRAFLLSESARLTGGVQAKKNAINFAAAVELVHSYSLIHDDLPCMDNSSLRRGKPSLHVKFDEATAILVGDALQSFAFGMIAEESDKINPDKRLLIALELSKAIGYMGMVAGQMLDLNAEKKNKIKISESYIKKMQELKTGALISFSLRAGGLIGGAKEIQHFTLKLFGDKIGLAFQIVDDILDRISSEENLGKQVNLDKKSGKASFVEMFGLEESKVQVKNLISSAKKDLKIFGHEAKKLIELSDFIENRQK